MTSLIPSTTFSFDTSALSSSLSPEQQKVSLVVTHHNGLQYAPFWDSLVVPNDLLQMQKKADVILKLSNEIAVTWNASDCQFHGAGKVLCAGNTERQTVNGKTIVPWAFYSSKNLDSSFAGDFQYYFMTFVFYIDDEKYSYTMKYQDYECEFRENGEILGKNLLSKSK